MNFELLLIYFLLLCISDFKKLSFLHVIVTFLINNIIFFPPFLELSALWVLLFTETAALESLQVPHSFFSEASIFPVRLKRFLKLRCNHGSGYHRLQTLSKRKLHNLGDAPRHILVIWWSIPQKQCSCTGIAWYNSVKTIIISGSDYSYACWSNRRVGIWW